MVVILVVVAAAAAAMVILIALYYSVLYSTIRAMPIYASYTMCMYACILLHVHTHVYAM